MDRRTPPHRHNTPPHHHNTLPHYPHRRNTPPNYIHRTPPGAYPVPTRSTTKDPRIPGISVFNLEQLKNPQVYQHPTRNRDDVHRKQPIAATPLETRLDHVQVMMSQLLKSAQDLVEDMKKENNRRRDRSSSRDHPRYEVHQPNSVLHQVIQEAPLLASPLIKQLETKSPEIIAPALIVQDSVNRSEDVREISVQEFQKVFAHQVFEETPQPGVKADDGASKGSKSQKPEVYSKCTVKDISCVAKEVSIQRVQEILLQIPSKFLPESTPIDKPPVLEIQEVPREKVHELEIDFLMDVPKLEMSLCVKDVKDYSIVFPTIDTEELSYIVEVNCELAANNVAVIRHQFPQEIRRHGTRKKRIGVG